MQGTSCCAHRRQARQSIALSVCSNAGLARNENGPPRTAPQEAWYRTASLGAERNPRIGDGLWLATYRQFLIVPTDRREARPIMETNGPYILQCISRRSAKRWDGRTYILKMVSTDICKGSVLLDVSRRLFKTGKQWTACCYAYCRIERYEAQGHSHRVASTETTGRLTACVIKRFILWIGLCPRLPS